VPFPRRTQLAIAVPRRGFVDGAVGVAERVGLCVGVVAYALEAWREPFCILLWGLGGFKKRGRGEARGYGDKGVGMHTLSMSVQRAMAGYCELVSGQG